MAQATTRRARRPIVFRSAVLPYKPPIDKVVALALLEMWLNETESLPLKQVLYYKKNEVTDAQYAQWERDKVFVIDVGPKAKYHQIGVGSATQKFVDEFINITPDVQQLVDLINKNNQTGHLKGQHLSVAHLLREFYELSDEECDHLQVVNAGVHVTQMFLKALDKESHVRPVADYETEMPELADELKGCNYGPFTLGRYARDMFVLGVGAAGIRRHIEFWTERLAVLQAERARGEAELAAMAVKTFSLSAHGGTVYGAVIETDDRFVAGAAIRHGNWQIRVIRKSNGHTVISTSGQLDMSNLAKALEQQEPKRWFHQPSTGTLLNGGPQYTEVTATALSPDSLVALMRFNAPARKEQGQQRNRQQSARRA